MDTMEPKCEGRGSIKKKIRDTQRLLAKEELPETVRLTKERVLKLLQRKLQERQKDDRDKKTAKKYRMVKFFERRKVGRKLKSRLRELSTCIDREERIEITDDVQRLRRELNYIAYYPDREKYISLYPSTQLTSAKALARRDKLMSEIEAEVQSGDLADASENIGPGLSQKLTGKDKDHSESESEQETGGKEEDPGVCQEHISTTGTGHAVATRPSTRSRPVKRSARTSLVDNGVEELLTKPPKKERVKRALAPVDEDPTSESELYLESRKTLYRRR